MLLLAACGRPGGGSLGPLAGHIVISRENNLWIMGPGAGDARKLTDASKGSLARDPQFSPDGSRLAYSYYPMNPAQNTWAGPELWVVNSDGSNARKLVGGGEQGERFESPCWASNDILYYSHDRVITRNNQYVGDDFSVERVDVRTGKNEPVIKNATSPSLSAEGKMLVYLRIEKFQLSLMAQAASGSGPVRKLLGPEDFFSIYAPRLSADGSKVIFAGSGRTNSRVGSAPVSGGSLASWLQPFAAEPARAHGLPFDLWVINADGTNLRKLAQLDWDEFQPAWSPDGSKIATIGFAGLWIMNADGSGRTQFAKQGEPAGIDWTAK